MIYDTNPGSFGTSSVPGGNEVTIDCGDPSASAGAGVSMMIIVFYFNPFTQQQQIGKMFFVFISITAIIPRLN